MLQEEKDSRDRRFRKANRLKKSSEFQNVFKHGRKVVTPTLVFHIVPNERVESRLGLAVSRKVGKAVKRNFVKRRIREAFRHQKDLLPQSFDIVVYPRKGILERSSADYFKSFAILIKVARKKFLQPAPRGIE